MHRTLTVLPRPSIPGNAKALGLVRDPGDDTLTRQRPSQAEPDIDDDDKQATAMRLPRPSFLVDPPLPDDEQMTPVGQKKPKLTPPIAKGALISNAAMKTARPVAPVETPRPKVPRPTPSRPPLAVGPALLPALLPAPEQPLETPMAMAVPESIVVVEPESGATRVAPIAQPGAPVSTPPVALSIPPPPPVLAADQTATTARITPAIPPHRIALIGSLGLMIAALTFAVLRRPPPPPVEATAAPVYVPAVEVPPPPVQLAPPAPQPLVLPAPAPVAPALSPAISAAPAPQGRSHRHVRRPTIPNHREQ